MVNLKILRDIDQRLYEIFNNIKKYKFKCSLCGFCCTYQYNKDNTVYIRYDEIKKIIEEYNFPFLYFVSPFYPDIIKYKMKYGLFYIKKYLKKLKEQIDNNGNIYIFGWKLKRKSNGNCIFYNDKLKICNIYKYRPSLCATYPYYIDINTFNLKISLCDNITNTNINKYYNINNIKLFSNIIDRYINDLIDIKLIGHNTKKISNKIFNSKEGLFRAYTNFRNGFLKFIVYDQ